MEKILPEIREYYYNIHKGIVLDLTKHADSPQSYRLLGIHLFRRHGTESRVTGQLKSWLLARALVYAAFSIAACGHFLHQEMEPTLGRCRDYHA
jgi:hypothetical protein